MVVNCKISIVFFLLISATLYSSSYVAVAGRSASKLVHEAASGGDAKYEEVMRKREVEVEMGEVEERLLRESSKDYGKYDQTPTFVKPPFKLIPN